LKMRGRKKKPTVIKLVTGNPGRYPLNKKEPKPEAGCPEAPEWLSEKAKTAWPRVAQMLVDMGVLAVNDALGLEALCEAYAEVREARESLKKPITLTDAEGNSYEVAKGGELTYVTVGKFGPMIRVRPEIAVISDADRRLRSLLSEFGMTPAARARVQVLDDREEEDPLARFISWPGFTIRIGGLLG
jgi:P27 family predicted phage terminase small subunit